MKACTNTHDCSYWRGIMMHRKVYDENVSFVVGNGAGIKFWNEKSVCSVALKK